MHYATVLAYVPTGGPFSPATFAGRLADLALALGVMSGLYLLTRRHERGVR